MSTETSNAQSVAESAQGSAPPAKPPGRLLWIICGIALLPIAAAYAYYTVFSQALGIDEGYLMITVQGFLDGHALHDVVFTQYGSAYYAYEWLLHGLLPIPLTHDATRLLCIAHWLGAAALLGVAARVITGSLLAGLFGFAQGLIHLTHLAREPGHPQEVIAILLAGAVIASTRVREHRGGLPALGLIAATLFFIKPNVGIFFGAALFLTLHFHSDRSGRNAHGRTWLLIAACALLPFLLMRRHVMHEWCRNYALLASIAIVATALTGRDAPARQIALRRWLGAATGFAAGAIMFAGVALLTGTSPAGLLDGLLLTPLKTPNIAILPFKVPNAALVGAGVSLLVAALVSVSPRLRVTQVALKLGFAVVSAFVLIGKPHPQLIYLLPWVWLVALAPQTGCGSTAIAMSFPRVFLALAAAWQSLQGYPIAGTQITIGSLFVVLAATVCLADVALHMTERGEGIAARWGQRALPRVAVAIALVCLFAFAWCQLPAVRKQHASLIPLNLPGAALVRTDAERVNGYRALAEYLTANCDTFITIPGVNDFYFWTGKRPPTQLNPTSISILTTQQQEQVCDALRRADRPLIAILAAIIDNPRHGGPLINAVREDYVEVHRIDAFKIFGRKRE